MMALLEEEQRKTANSTNNDELDNIVVEVFFPRPQHDDKAAIFTEINKAEPIKLLDLP
jgi:hypothetical protein